MTPLQYVEHVILPAFGLAFTAAVAAGWAIGIGGPL